MVTLRTVVINWVPSFEYIQTNKGIRGQIPNAVNRQKCFDTESFTQYLNCKILHGVRFCSLDQKHSECESTFVEII